MANIVRTITANNRTRISNRGEFIRLREAGAELIVHVNGDSYPMAAGDSLEDFKRPFDYFEIESDTAQTVEFIVSDGAFRSNRQQGELSLKAGDSLNGLPEITLTAAAAQVAANAARKKIYLSAPDTNAAAIWIGATATGNGLPLEAGDVLLLDIVGAVDYIGASGDKLNILEVV